MIITCPHCQTKYQVTYEAIGSAGRKVQCAHCNRAWQQAPIQAEQVEPPHTDAISEDAMDEAFAAEESAAAAEQGKTIAKPGKSGKPAKVRAQKPPKVAKPKKVKNGEQVAFSRRQNALSSKLPMGKLRRTARIVGVLGLAAIVAIGYFGRVGIVQQYPAMAGAYAAIGLPTNVVGLTFAQVQTLKALSGGQEVLSVSAQIVGREARPMPVPPVVVSLLDDKGDVVYEWSVSPQVRNLMGGERATFDTRLAAPPATATKVRLSFSDTTPTAVEVPTPDLSPDGAAEATEPAGTEIHSSSEASAAEPAASPDHH